MIITVVGSINTDLMVDTKQVPQQGETVYGQDFQTQFGGKGSNQAIVAAKIGAEVYMVGAVGDDEFGAMQLENYQSHGVHTRYIDAVKDTPTGTATIITYENDNRIIIVSGANNAMTVQRLKDAEEILAESDMVILQNEIPQETNEAVIDFCHEKGIQLLLNPAPARELDQAYIDKIDFLTPNESEFNVLFPGKSYEEVLADYPNKLIVTVGSKGAIFHDGQELVHVPAAKAERIVDSTGAGDTFNGAFAVAYIGGLKVGQAVKFSNIASSLAIQKYGAQTGAPSLAEIKAHPDYDANWQIEI